MEYEFFSDNWNFHHINTFPDYYLTAEIACEILHNIYEADNVSKFRTFIKIINQHEYTVEHGFSYHPDDKKHFYFIISEYDRGDYPLDRRETPRYHISKKQWTFAKICAHII